MKKLLAVLLCLGLCGCATGVNPEFAQVSSGLVGCPPADIQVSNITGNSWTAVCKGTTYYCSQESRTVSPSCTVAK